MCNPLEKDVAILVINTVSIRRVMKSQETVCMDVRWDFMETSVTKVGFFKGHISYITFLLYSFERNNNESKFCAPTNTVFHNDNDLSFVKYQDRL